MYQKQALRFPLQSQRLIRATQRTVLKMVWGMAGLMLLGSYLRHGELRSSSLLVCALMIVFTAVMVVVRPQQVISEVGQRALVADGAGLRIEGGPFTRLGLSWSEIADIQPRRFLGLDLLMIVPTDPVALKNRLGVNWYLNRWLGGVALVVTAFGDARELATQLKAYRQENEF